MLELLILLSSDISPYRDTFDMIHRYTWSLYRPISTIRPTEKLLTLKNSHSNDVIVESSR